MSSIANTDNNINANLINLYHRMHVSQPQIQPIFMPPMPVPSYYALPQPSYQTEVFMLQQRIARLELELAMRTNMSLVAAAPVVAPVAEASVAKEPVVVTETPVTEEPAAEESAAAAPATEEPAAAAPVAAAHVTVAPVDTTTKDPTPPAAPVVASVAAALTLEGQLMMTDTHKVPAVPTIEEQMKMKCPYCPSVVKEHTFATCNHFNRCTKCYHFGHGSAFCKTPKEEQWDKEYKSPYPPEWWTKTAEEPTTIIVTTFTKVGDKINRETRRIDIKPGFLLPAEGQCCSFVNCTNGQCKRRYHKVK